MEPFLPEIVSKDGDGYYAVDYAKVTPVLVEALHELRAEKDAQIDALRSENDSIKARVARLEALVETLGGAKKVGW